MAEGAFEAHVYSLVMFANSMKQKHEKFVTPDDLNPYSMSSKSTVADKPIEAPITALKNLLGIPNKRKRKRK